MSKPPKHPKHARLYAADLDLFFDLSQAEIKAFLALRFSGFITIEHGRIISKSSSTQAQLAQMVGCSSGTMRRGISALKQRFSSSPELGTLEVNRRMGSAAITVLSISLEPELAISSQDELTNSSQDDRTISSGCELNVSSDMRELTISSDMRELTDSSDMRELNYKAYNKDNNKIINPWDFEK